MAVNSLPPAPDYRFQPAAAIRVVPGVLGDPQPPPTPPVEPSVRTEPPRFTLVARYGLTGNRIVAFPTVDVQRYTKTILGVRPATHDVTVALNDPAWPLLIQAIGLGSSWNRPLITDIGHAVHRVSWELWRDGTLVASGISDGPVSSGDRIELRITGGAGLLRDRFLGDGGIRDFLGGRGEWPTASLAGWTISHVGSGLQYRFVTTDTFQGARTLQLRGTGTLTTPYTTPIPAQPQGSQRVRTEVIARASAGALTVQTNVVGGTNSNAAGLDPRVNDWQELRAAGLIPAGTGGHRVRAVLSVFSSDWIDVGRVRIGQTELVGALARNPQKLETLVRVVIEEAQTPRSGGDLGITLNIQSETGVRDAMRWAFQDNPTVTDALSSIVDRADGPDVWFTPDSTLNVAARAGRNRNDIVLNRDTVVTANIETDPSLRYDSLRVNTGFGAGTNRSVIATETRSTPGAPVRRALIQAPPELSYRSAGYWADGQAQFAALTKTSLHVTVPEWFGDQINIGDRVRVELDVDGWHIAGRYRVGRIDTLPHQSLIALEVGLGEFDSKAGSRWTSQRQNLVDPLLDTDFGGGGTAALRRLIQN